MKWLCKIGLRCDGVVTQVAADREVIRAIPVEAARLCRVALTAAKRAGDKLWAATDHCGHRNLIQPSCLV